MTAPGAEKTRPSPTPCSRGALQSRWLSPWQCRPGMDETHGGVGMVWWGLWPGEERNNWDDNGLRWRRICFMACDVFTHRLLSDKYKSWDHTLICWRFYTLWVKKYMYIYICIYIYIYKYITMIHDIHFSICQVTRWGFGANMPEVIPETGCQKAR